MRWGTTEITMNAKELRAYIRKAYSNKRYDIGAFCDCFSKIRLALYGETITIAEYKRLNEYLNALDDKKYEMHRA